MIGPVFDQDFRNQLRELFVWRRDVRHFRTDPVPESVLASLLALIGLSPSVGLSEPWRLVRVNSIEARAAVRHEFERCNSEALSARADEEAARYARLKLAGLDRAPVQLAVFAEPDPAKGGGLGRETMPETTLFSAVLAIHTVWLAARAQGIGLGWVSILDPARIGEILDVSRTWRFVAYLCLGYPLDEQDLPELSQTGWEHRAPLLSILDR